MPRSSSEGVKRCGAGRRGGGEGGRRAGGRLSAESMCSLQPQHYDGLLFPGTGSPQQRRPRREQALLGSQPGGEEGKAPLTKPPRGGEGRGEGEGRSLAGSLPGSTCAGPSCRRPPSAARVSASAAEASSQPAGRAGAEMPEAAEGGSHSVPSGGSGEQPAAAAAGGQPGGGGALWLEGRGRQGRAGLPWPDPGAAGAAGRLPALALRFLPATPPPAGAEDAWGVPPPPTPPAEGLGLERVRAVPGGRLPWRGAGGGRAV